MGALPISNRLLDLQLNTFTQMSVEKNSPQVVVYDKAKYHFKGNFPDSLPIEQAYVHIGMFMGWIIEKELYSEFFEEECEIQMIRFKRRELTCTVLCEIWDGHLGSDLFTEEGNMFTYYYYGGGIFRKDYETLLINAETPTIYHVKDTWENFDLISKKIEARYQEWKKILS
jgi:hypothetical protein